jgi:2-hydroxy-3-oxopropionate reductase
MKIAFIGLGAMGRPMVEHLIAAGHEVHVWSRRTTSADFALALGAAWAASPAQLAQRCDVVCTNVYSDPDVQALALGVDGILSALPAGGVHVDFSTISPSLARTLAARYVERGAHFVDAPVSGGAVGARAASLAIMWGGSAALESRLAPLFACVGQRAVRIGDSGAGQVAKACNQLVMVAAIEACAEAALLAQATGVDFARVRCALMGGSAGSRVLEVFGARMASRDFVAGVPLQLHHKDFDLLLGEMQRAGLPSIVASSVKQQLNAAMALDGGVRDTASLLAVLEHARLGHAGLDHADPV